MIELVNKLKAHDFGATRFGNRIQLRFGLMDSPCQVFPEFGPRECTAGTRKLKADVPLIDQLIEEISIDLLMLARPGDDSLMYGVFLYKHDGQWLRYAKVTNINLDTESSARQHYLEAA